MSNQLKTDRMRNFNFYFDFKETNLHGHDMYDVQVITNYGDKILVFHGTFDNCVKYLEMMKEHKVEFTSLPIEQP